MKNIKTKIKRKKTINSFNIEKKQKKMRRNSWIILTRKCNNGLENTKK